MPTSAHHNYDLPLSPFEQQVVDTLKLCKFPLKFAKIGKNSPLASAHFLQQITTSPVTELSNEARGKFLYKEIQRAVNRLWGDTVPGSPEAMLQALKVEQETRNSERYACLLLELRYFQQYLHPPTIAAIYQSGKFLSIAQSEYYRDIHAAIQKVAAHLLKRIAPGIQHQQLQPVAQMVGYHHAEQRISEALAQGKTVAISGAGGMGKSTLGAAVVARRGQKPTFWYTVRLTLNDSLNSFLFALGHFLQQKGAASLWKYLHDNQGEVRDPQKALDCARGDCLALQSTSPLLCFDELERLRVWPTENSLPQHVQLFEFIDGLRGIIPMLFIGQRPIFEADVHQALDGLAAPQIVELWRQSEMPITDVEATQLFRYTGGNPRFLLLCRALQQPDESIADLLLILPRKPDLQPILQRIWVRLEAGERQLLQQLTLFRSFVPADRWETTALQNLRARRLIQYSQQGGVAVLPAIREVIEADSVLLPPEQKAQMHRQAADLSVKLLEYTEAAFHYWQSGEESKAIQCWFPYMQQEILRGQAESARQIFEGMLDRHLKTQEQNILYEIRSRLRQLSGKLESALAALKPIVWPAESESRVRVLKLRANLRAALGYPEQALLDYAEASRVLQRMMATLGGLHRRNADIHIQQRERDEAQRQVDLLECELYLLQGALLFESGKIEQAYQVNQKAAAIAKQVQDEDKLIRSEIALLRYWGVYRQQIEPMLVHNDNVINAYQRIGDRLEEERYKGAKLAAIYIQCKEFQRAIEVAEPAYRFLKAVHDNYLAAATGINLAEGYLGLNQIDKTEECALEVLDMEQRHEIPYAYSLLGRVQHRRNDLAKAEAQLRRALEVAQQNQDPYMGAYAHQYLGELYLDWKNRKNALQHLRLANHFFAPNKMTLEAEKTTQLIEQAERLTG